MHTGEENPALDVTKDSIPEESVPDDPVKDSIQQESVHDDLVTKAPDSPSLNGHVVMVDETKTNNNSTENVHFLGYVKKGKHMTILL